MKKLISFLVAFLIFSSLTFLGDIKAFAYIESDGTVNLHEWENCDQTILFQGYEISDTCYRSIHVKYRYISLDRRIYIAVVAENGNTNLSKVPEENYTELYFSFNNSSEITICSDGNALYNKDEFFLRHGSKTDSFGSVSYEAETLLKELGYDDKLTMYVQMKDYNGNLTQLFEIEIKSEELKEKESESIAESEKQSEKDAKENAKASKKKTTSKKETTTELETAIITEEYAPYSAELKKGNREIIVIGVTCVLTSIAAMCVSVFKKDKKE